MAGTADLVSNQVWTAATITTGGQEQGRFITLVSSIDRQTVAVQVAKTITGEASRASGGNQITVRNPLAYEPGKLIELTGIGSFRILSISGFTLTLDTTITPSLADAEVTFPQQIKLDTDPGVTQSNAAVTFTPPVFVTISL